MRGAKRDGDARRRVRAARGVQKRVVQPAASRDRSAQRPELSSSSRVPVDVRPCVHMWAVCLWHTARLTPLPSTQWSHAVSDYSNAKENTVATIAPPYARAHAIAQREPYTARS